MGRVAYNKGKRKCQGCGGFTWHVLGCSQLLKKVENGEISPVIEIRVGEQK